LQRRRAERLPTVLLSGDTSSDFIARIASSGWPVLFKAGAAA